jgi:hypothetical protein
MELFGELIIKNPVVDNIFKVKSSKKVIVGEAGLKPSRGERIYIFRRKFYNVEKELSDEDLNLVNKNRNIKVISVSFGHTKDISRMVKKHSAFIVFYYKGKQKSIKNILKQIPGTIYVDESYDKYGKFYEINGRAGSRTWWHNAALVLSKIT